MNSFANDPFDETLLSAYLDQELEPSERALVERELEKSPELQTLIAELSQIRNMVAKCSIPMPTESKSISGPWESSSSSTLVASQSVWIKLLPRLASLAAVIALLFGLGAVVYLSTNSGRLISYQSTDEKVVSRNVSSLPDPASRAVPPTAAQPPAAPKPPTAAQQGSDPAKVAKKTDPMELKSVASSEMDAESRASDLPTNKPRFSTVPSNESLAERFTRFLSNEAKEELLRFGEDKSLASDRATTTGLFRVVTNEVIEEQNAFGTRTNSPSKAIEPFVELIIPEAKWELAKALLVEKGFAFEETPSNSDGPVSAQTLSFLASPNRLSPAEWTIVALDKAPKDKKDKQSESKPVARKLESGTEGIESKRTVENVDLGESKLSETRFRRIRITLSEEFTKSSSNE